MLLGFFIVFLLFEEYRYTLSVNPMAVGPPIEISSSQGSLAFFPTAPGINFEMKLKDSVSLNFELNNVLFIFPFEAEVGVRGYLGAKEFEGFYFYGGLASWIFGVIWKGIGLIDLEDFSELIRPHLILTFGYKYISEERFTLDPFLGLKILPFFPLPVIGLYLGYSW